MQNILSVFQMRKQVRQTESGKRIRQAPQEQRKALGSISLLLSLCFSLLFFSSFCGEGSSGSGLDKEKLASPSTPQDYCLHFKKLELEQSRELYGLVCGVTSEDAFIKLDNAEATEKIRNCRPFFFVGDDDPLATNTIGDGILNALIDLFAPEMREKLPPDDLMELYESDDEAPTIEAGSKNYNIRRTFRLEDKRNQRILLMALPIFDAESTACGGIIHGLLSREVTDCVLYSKRGFTTKAGVYPAILEIRDPDFYSNPFAPQERVLVLEENEARGGSVKFHFEVERRTCENESPEERLPIATAPSTPRPTISPTPENPYCVHLDSITGGSSGTWGGDDSPSPDTGELFGKVCAQRGGASGLCSSYLWDREDRIGSAMELRNGQTVNIGTSLTVDAGTSSSISLLFYSIYDRDFGGTNDLLNPPSGYGENYPSDPAILNIGTNRIGSTPLQESSTFTLGTNDGQATFNFRISRGACP